MSLVASSRPCNCGRCSTFWLMPMVMQTPAHWLQFTLFIILGLVSFNAQTTSGGAFKRGSIPKIIHQSWKVETLPMKLRRWQQTLK